MFMNGEVFAGLNKLNLVSLIENTCIDENYEHPTQIKAMYREVSQKCGFKEDRNSEASTEKTQLEIPNQKSPEATLNVGKIWLISLFALVFIASGSAIVYVKHFKQDRVRYF
jgi:hypothetical protein